MVANLEAPPPDRVYVTPSPIPWFYIQLDHLNIHR